MLELIDVCKHYDHPNSDFVLKDINLRVESGQSLAVCGPSGSGKSTLLNLIGTLDTITSGKIMLNGRDLTALDQTQLGLIRNRHIGFVFQLHHLLGQCSVWENVLLPTIVHSRKEDKQQYDDRARQLLERVGLTDRASYLPGLLSGGERQRVAVVRALINSPKLLLADEPTGSLDRAAAESLTDLLMELNRDQGITVIVATHSERLAQRMTNLWELKDGRLLARAT